MRAPIPIARVFSAALTAAVAAAVPHAMEEGFAPGQSAANVRPASNRPACRVFAASLTTRDTGVGGSRTTESKVTFDAATSQLRQQSNVSQSAGQSYRSDVVWVYDSTADFINEVVRVSGVTGVANAGSSLLSAASGRFEPSDEGRGIFLSRGFDSNYRTVARVAGGATNAITVSGTAATTTDRSVVWAVNTVPPLVLVRETRFTGGVQGASKRTYDRWGRVTSMTNTVGSLSTITEYTAWDKFGRPTADRVKAPNYTATDTFEYDDLKRTLVHIHSQPQQNATSRVEQDFDVYGIMIAQRVDLNGKRQSTTAVEIHEMTSVCHNGGTPPPLARGKTAAPAHQGRR